MYLKLQSTPHNKPSASAKNRGKTLCPTTHLRYNQCRGRAKSMGVFFAFGCWLFDVGEDDVTIRFSSFPCSCVGTHTSARTMVRSVMVPCRTKPSLDKRAEGVEQCCGWGHPPSRRTPRRPAGTKRQRQPWRPDKSPGTGRRRGGTPSCAPATTRSKPEGKRGRTKGGRVSPRAALSIAITIAIPM